MDDDRGLLWLINFWKRHYCLRKRGFVLRQDILSREILDGPASNVSIK
jgi:hypothetical protein